jgi:hypothetical protein
MAMEVSRLLVVMVIRDSIMVVGLKKKALGIFDS